MRAALASLLLVASPAWAQFTQAALDARGLGCADCGVITAIQARTTEGRTAVSRDAPSGLVATVPFGSGKTQVGPSQKLGREAVVSETDWRVVVKLDNGGYRILTLDQRADWQEGDSVRVEGSRLLHR